MTELVNLAELFLKKEYVESLESSKEQLKMPRILDRPIVLTGYETSTLVGAKSGEEEECFKMSFYFADDENKTPHYIKSQASRIWDYLRAVNDVNPELLASGTVTTMVVEVQMKGKFGQKQYVFAGTEN